jgi:hypothetical protein
LQDTRWAAREKANCTGSRCSVQDRLCLAGAVAAWPATFPGAQARMAPAISSLERKERSNNVASGNDADRPILLVNYRKAFVTGVHHQLQDTC